MADGGSPGISRLERVLKRDRLIVAVCLLLVFTVGAAYTAAGIGMGQSAIAMTRIALEFPDMAMAPAAWTPGAAALMFGMWLAMMIAMMTPSAAPVVLIHAAVHRKQAGHGGPFGATGIFVAGYVAVWAGFSLLATALQWGLESLGVATGMMQIANPAIAGATLIAAGLYQLTPLKQTCLRQCQNPFNFIMGNWRAGRAGAFAMGARHGIYCIGCCWFLMALLFVGGIMNLVWIAGIAIFIAIEKFAAGQRLVTAGTGIVLTAAGLMVLARHTLAA